MTFNDSEYFDILYSEEKEILFKVFPIIEKFCQDNQWPYDKVTETTIVQMLISARTMPSRHYFNVKFDNSGENITSLMIGDISDHFFSDIIIATEWFVYSSDHSGKEMLDKFVTWSKDNGANVVYCSSPNSYVDTWLEKQGFQFKEKAYIKWL